jgi:class III poly(R)-hydroxyalkanoic acid synthase PhaE subunit
VDHDPWQQWLALSASLGSPGGAGAAPFAPPFGPPFAPPQDFAERFNQAARAFVGAAGPNAAPAAAARVFSEALRDMFSQLQPPLNFAAPAAGAKPEFALQSLAFGSTREHQLRGQRLTEAGQQLDGAQRRLQRLWLDALREAGTAFAARLAQPPTSADPAAMVRQYYDLWIDCAEDAYSRTAHGAAFCDALAESVNAASRWRRELRDIVEHSAQLLDLPTRSEINTLQQRLRAVEAQLRAAPKTRSRRKKSS